MESRQPNRGRKRRGLDRARCASRPARASTGAHARRSGEGPWCRLARRRARACARWCPIDRDRRARSFSYLRRMPEAFLKTGPPRQASWPYRSPPPRRRGSTRHESPPARAHRAADARRATATSRPQSRAHPKRARWTTGRERHTTLRPFVDCRFGDARVTVPRRTPRAPTSWSGRGLAVMRARPPPREANLLRGALHRPSTDRAAESSGAPGSRTALFPSPLSGARPSPRMPTSREALRDWAWPTY